MPHVTLAASRFKHDMALRTLDMPYGTLSAPHVTLAAPHCKRQMLYVKLQITRCQQESRHSPSKRIRFVHRELS
jgi:hypothetical protein